MSNNKNVGFSERFKAGDTIYVWFPDNGGCRFPKVYHYSKSHRAYLVTCGLYVRETDLIFDTLEELYEYGKEHKNEIVRDDGCGYSFGCDFLE